MIRADAALENQGFRSRCSYIAQLVVCRLNQYASPTKMMLKKVRITVVDAVSRTEFNKGARTYAIHKEASKHELILAAL